MSHEVVVTGMGCISAVGKTVDEHWCNVANGHAGIRDIQSFDVSGLGVKIAAEVVDFEPGSYFSRKELRLLDRSTQFALISAQEAVENSGLDFSSSLGQRTGIVIGTGVGARHTNDDILADFFLHGKPIPPIAIPKGLFNAAASHISIRYGITGPSWMVTTACASSNNAIGQAFELVRNGHVDVAITGGTEAPITQPFFKAWEALRILDPVTCRPFDKERKGLVLGEGAAIVILESLSHAQRRGAHIYARVCGYGMSSDALDLIRMSPTGAVSAMQAALDYGKIPPDNIDYINAHGTGTVLNDATESQAIEEVFGEHSKQLLISSTKSTHGHALGAAGALEFVATVKAIETACVPPTANLDVVDPECRLDYVPGNSRRHQIRAALSNAFAFGGTNAVIALRDHRKVG